MSDLELLAAVGGVASDSPSLQGLKLRLNDVTMSLLSLSESCSHILATLHLFNYDRNTIKSKNGLGSTLLALTFKVQPQHFFAACLPACLRMMFNIYSVVITQFLHENFFETLQHALFHLGATCLTTNLLRRLSKVTTAGPKSHVYRCITIHQYIGNTFHLH